ncbi:MAG: archaellin/type IV pilin N-terminal domain-containing protein, partial [Candidatus Bathyarchaeia archaeon]
MAKKPSESKKAISPILATLLLIVIAVAAIVVTYA